MKKIYYDKNKIHELISQQCKESPKNIAVYEYGKELTYEELEKKSNCVARALIKAGVKVGQPIVVVSARNTELIITIVAILKCGGVYVPVDDSYPEQRIISILEDTGSKIVIDLSKSEILLKKQKLIKINIFSFKELYKLETDLKWDHVDIASDNLAYIIYTSGTTGSPKGVMVSHKAVLNTLFWMNEEFKLTHTDRIAHKTSISFTDSIWEIFWPLIFGAEISIINNIDSKNPRKLYKCLLNQKIKITQFVPSMLKVFLEYIEINNIKDPLPDLKWILNGGEYITVNLAKRFNLLFSNAKIANIYGSTESAIYATYYIIEKDLIDSLESIPMGKPITNSEIYIYNDNKLCQINEKGEICICGKSLSIGYWNDEELTRQKFVKDIFDKKIMYKTGDMGYIDSYGCIWYCGRMDNQVKISGNRVELYEIEKNILSYEGIGQVAIIVKKDKYDENYLVCFLVNQEIDIVKLKEFLGKRIPSYMIPLKFLFIDEFPLTINKKIDKKKLSLYKD